MDDQAELEQQAIEQGEAQGDVVDVNAVTPDPLTELQEKFDTLTQQNQQLTSVLDRFKQPSTPEPVVEEGYKPEPVPEDLEDMSREAAMNWNNGRLIAQMNAEVVKPLIAQINSLQGNIQKESASSSIEKMQTKHPDFNHWGNEIADKIESSPGMEMEDAYQLSRIANPTKAVEMDKKFSKPSAATPLAEEKPTLKAPEVSFRPNSGDTPIDRSGKSFAEASDKAWNQHGADITEALRAANMD